MASIDDSKKKRAPNKNPSSTKAKHSTTISGTSSSSKNSAELTGLFIVDLQGLDLTQNQLRSIEASIQDAVQSELASIDDTEGLIGGPLGGGLAGFRAA